MAKSGAALLLVILALSLEIGMGEAIAVFVHNRCPFTVCAKFWVPQNGVGGGCSQLGFGGTWPLGVSPRWKAGTIWAIANTGCAGQPCHTGPPAGVTQFEITVAGGRGNDYYDLSSIAGYNIGMQVVPTNGGCPSKICRGQNAATCPTGYYPNGPDAAKGCRTGSTDYNLYLCP